MVSRELSINGSHIPPQQSAIRRYICPISCGGDEGYSGCFNHLNPRMNYFALCLCFHVGKGNHLLESRCCLSCSYFHFFPLSAFILDKVINLAIRRGCDHDLRICIVDSVWLSKNSERCVGYTAHRSDKSYYRSLSSVFSQLMRR